MNKTAIKNYAVWARVQLIESARQKAYEYAITDGGENTEDLDSICGRLLTAQEKDQRRHLIAEIKHEGYESVIEEAAYTWFNRFTALRFMEVNGYLPSQIRLFTDENGRFKPEILKEAVNIDFAGIDRAKVFELIDGQDNEALYKYLLIAQCNDLSTALPRMFEKIANWTELLFPGNLLKPDSVLGRMVTDIPEEDWTDQVQIIGWLYQYYNSELKDDTFARLKQNIKISKDRIPAATQLFTPDWIVRYMVENSLGRIFISEKCSVGSDQQTEQERITKEKEIAENMGWRYYLPEAEQSPEVRSQLNQLTTDRKPLTTIKLIDPCMGSGHILVYAFEVLMQIYTASGWNERDAVRSILENNLYGLDIDDRAAQLAYFAVMMKARQYDRRIFSRGIQPNVYSIVESNWLDAGVVDYFTDNDPKLQKDFGILCQELRDAKEYGSILNISQVDFAALYARVEEVRNDISLFREMVLDSILPLIQVAEVMAQKYDVVVTNPPYMTVSSASVKLNEFVRKNFPDSKSDLFAVFMEKCHSMLKETAFQAMITMHSWMFLASYECLRQKIYHQDIVSIAHLGPRAFEEISGEIVQTASFVFRNTNTKQYKGTYCRLVEYNTQDAKEDAFLRHQCIFTSKQDGYDIIPGSPVAYWVSEEFLKCYDNPLIASVAFSDGQILTGNNDKYLRNLWEVNKADIESRNWALHAKGGEFRRWYGNIDTVVKFDSATISHYKQDKIARFPKEEILFRRGITWTLVSMNPNFGVRELDSKLTFNKAAATILFNNEEIIDYLLGFLNSKVAQALLRVINPTMNNNIKDVLNMPYIYDESVATKVSTLVQDCIKIARDDWDSYETSWDFKNHPLV